MQPLHIPQLANRQDRTLEIIVDTLIPEFATLTPVRGKVIVKHGGTFLELVAQAETIITLKCDRCLQQYNHKLVLDTSEIIWLEETVPEPDRKGMEIRTDLDELVDSLSPEGHFDPTVWLYEQLCLSLPLRQLCATDCAGIIPPPEPDSEPSEAQQLLDSRWGILGTLKHQISE